MPNPGGIRSNDTRAVHMMAFLGANRPGGHPRGLERETGFRAANATWPGGLAIAPQLHGDIVRLNRISLL